MKKPTLNKGEIQAKLFSFWFRFDPL